MASVVKLTAAEVPRLINHCNRAYVPSNPDIDSSLSGENYKLSPDRGKSDYSYFLERCRQLYQYGSGKRKDLISAFSWVMTAPKDLPPEAYHAFFVSSYEFVRDRYGTANITTAYVHMDESQPHIHVIVVPAVADNNPTHPQNEKLCCKAIINREELRAFHPAWQQHLAEQGIAAAVCSGITQKQGRNRTVWQLKQEREYQHKITYEQELKF